MEGTTSEHNTFWSIERIGMLAVYRARGVTSTDMVPLLGATRSAICGKIKRLGLPLPIKKRTSPRPRKPERVLHLHRHRHIASPDVAAADTGPVPFLKRRANQCASILNERGKDGLAMTCGRPVRKGSPWCEAHFHLYTQPLEPRTDGKARYRD